MRLNKGLTVNEHYQILVKALQHLSSVCDGAHAQDGMGFNGRDTKFGKSLAEQSESRTLTPRQQQAAIRMLQTYQGQLKAANIALPEATEYQIYDNGSTKPRAKSRVSIRLDNGNILISFPYDPKLVERVKSLPDRRWNKKDKVWLAPTRIVNEVLAAFPNAKIDDEVKQLLERQRQLAKMSNIASSDFDVEGLGGELLPFQKAGVEFIETANGRAIIADQMGLGKTVEALAYLQLHPDLRPAIIVVPASLKTNWKREANKWLSTKKRIVVLNGTKPYDLSLSPADIYIINWDILTYWTDELLAIKPAILIADEAHYAKNRKAKRSKACKKLANKIDQALLLTGTPVTNRPVELFSLLQMVDSAAWPRFWPFAERYCGAYNDGWGWNFSGATNLDELHQKIKPYVVRRVKSQVLKELPAKRRVPVPIPMSDQARTEYEFNLKETIEILKQAERLSTHHLARIEQLKQLTAGGKLPHAIKWISDFLDSGEKLIVFATHKFIIAELMAEFGDQAVKLTGDDSQKARQDAVDRFQNDDQIRLFVGNIQAAGVGITLTAASDVAFLEFAWTPGDHDQAEDRAHRIGQSGSVTCWYLVAEDTIDEDIVSLLEDKRQVVDRVTDGELGDLKFGILNELVRKIAQ